MYKSHETYKGLKISLYSIIHAIKFLLQHEIVIFPRPVVKHLEFLLAIHVKKKKTNQSFCQLSMLKKKKQIRRKNHLRFVCQPRKSDLSQSFQSVQETSDSRFNSTSRYTRTIQIKTIQIKKYYFGNFPSAPVPGICSQIFLANKNEVNCLLCFTSYSFSVCNFVISFAKSFVFEYKERVFYKSVT